MHLPFEFYQPYLQQVNRSVGESAYLASSLAGVHLAITMLVGSWFTHFAGRVKHRCRVRLLLVGCVLWQV